MIQVIAQALQKVGKGTAEMVSLLFRRLQKPCRDEGRRDVSR